MQRRDLVKYALIAAPVAVSARASATEAGKNDGPVPDARLSAPLNPPATGEIQVAFLLSGDAEVVDFAGPWGVFDYVYIGDDGRKPFKLYTVAASRAPVNVSSGMTIVPDYSFTDAPAPHVVVVPAMDIEQLAPAALDWLRAVQKDTHLTMSVCNGSFVLAEAGLLDGKRASAHHGGYGMMRVMYPKVNVIRGMRYIEDGKIATAGGLTSGVDLAMRVVERYYGRDVAMKTAEQLEYQGTGWMYPNSNAAFAKKAVGTAERPVCPVCEAQISRAKAVEAGLTWEYRKKTYYFCGNWCREQFMATPDRFIEAA